MDFHQKRLSFWRDKGFSPRIVYDIGAHHGLWSKMTSGIFPEAAFYLFEANENHLPFLQRQSFPYFIHLLGDQDKRVIFYSIDGTGDSIFCENTSYYQRTKMKEKQMTPLSSVVKAQKLPPPDLIKMDVQGSEKCILQGSREIVCLAEMIIIETKVLEYNRDAPLLSEMVALMHELGFQPIDILEVHYLPTGELNEIDFLFAKQSSSFIKKGILI
jgi:FkbM family methyltransferase